MRSMIVLSIREKITMTSVMASRNRSGSVSDHLKSGVAMDDDAGLGGVFFGPFSSSPFSQPVQ
jgi:hypothetical protein